MNAAASQKHPVGWTIAQWQAAYREGGAQPETLLSEYAATPDDPADNAWIRRVDRATPLFCTSPSRRGS